MLIPVAVDRHDDLVHAFVLRLGQPQRTFALIEPFFGSIQAMLPRLLLQGVNRSLREKIAGLPAGSLQLQCIGKLIAAVNDRLRMRHCHATFCRVCSCRQQCCTRSAIPVDVQQSVGRLATSGAVSAAALPSNGCCCISRCAAQRRLLPLSLFASVFWTLSRARSFSNRTESDINTTASLQSHKQPGSSLNRLNRPSSKIQTLQKKDQLGHISEGASLDYIDQILGRRQLSSFCKPCMNS